MDKNTFPVDVWDNYYTKPVVMSGNEWAARCRLAACYRIFAHLGWVEVIFTHITHRLPGTDHQYLINPFGLLFQEITPLNLIVVDDYGKSDPKDTWATNPAGFTLHGIIHTNVPEAKCVMHTHTDAGSAVACSESGLSHNTFYGVMLNGMVAYHDFEGVTTRTDEAETLIPNIGNKPLVILRNHGLLSYANSIEMALTRLWTLQRACEIQVLQQATNTKMVSLKSSITNQSQENSFQLMDDSPTPALFFNALLREALGVENIEIEKVQLKSA